MPQEMLFKLDSKPTRSIPHRAEFSLPFCWEAQKKGNRLLTVNCANKLNSATRLMSEFRQMHWQLSTDN